LKKLFKISLVKTINKIRLNIMKNFKFYLAGSLVILFLLFFQFVFVVLKEATILDRAQKE